MLELIAHNLAPIMFISVMAMLLIGYPVALTLAAGGLFYFVAGVALSSSAPGEIHLFWPLLNAQPERVFGIMSNDTLLAVPFFTFMGLILERSGMAEDLLDTIGQLFGPIRGGLAYAVILVGALLAATTGVVAASVIAMGLISLPIMQRYGYSQRVATGTIAASGTLAQIIPPSLVLIVMADQLGVSVGDMYIGAMWPALIIVAVYCGYIFTLSITRPELVPSLPPEARTLGGGVISLILVLAGAVAVYLVAHDTIFADMRDETRLVSSAVTAVLLAYLLAVANQLLGLSILSRLASQVIIVLIPPLALVFLVLGTIFLGIATPTEGGAMGAVGAVSLAFLKRRLDFKTLRSSVEATTTLSAFVMFILIGARVFGLTFYGINGNIWLESLLLELPGGEYGFLFVVTIIVFILGCFLDFFEIAFILVPLLAPIAQKLGIDLVWFGVILGINLQTSFLTPPFGFSLFYLRSVAPTREWRDAVTGRLMPPVRTGAIYWGSLPFIGIQFLMILLIIAVPYLVLHYKTEAKPLEGAIEFAPPSFDGGAGNGGFGLPPLGAPGTPASPSNGATVPAPSFDLPPLNLGGPGSGASEGTPPADGGSSSTAPAMGLPPLTLGGPPPALGGPTDTPPQPAAAAPAQNPPDTGQSSGQTPPVDLSQPPSFN
ncbi:TRAP transporter large permease [Consotaella salsifontis]|uniref:TRAP transporter, DctM subunit n=1 Tax=Consotaella salsifontis TaxID=1365950 RepID=A0A1T4T3N7_9HYPH|nr:TRAP transporter large permease subunit [Consotaella salsifontis]SKA35026.1 TRAP transporter, DctM subunit [Consotaella salsifontis]